jgi:hypothetical protein
MLSMVTLTEDLFLLACDVTGRTAIDGVHLDLGLGGALVLDLMLLNRVAVADDRVTVVDFAPTGDSMLDGALARIGGQAKPRDTSYWVRHLARGARRTVEDRLVTAGVLRLDEHKVLGLIKVHRTPEADGRIQHELMNRLGEAVVLGHPAPPETAALASLVFAVGLDRHLFPRADRRAVRLRMQEIAEGEMVGAAVRRAIEAIDAAVGIPVELGEVAPSRD